MRHRAVLLSDETCLGEHLRVMVACLAYRRRAIPLAWECSPPEQYPQGGRVELVLALLDRMALALAGVSEVVVEADRGIGCSPKLLEGMASRAGAECRAFKEHGWLECRALGYWGEEAQLLVTNHPKVGAQASGERMWEELSFRDKKSGMWQWQSSQMRVTSHAEGESVLCGEGSERVKWLRASFLAPTSVAQ